MKFSATLVALSLIAMRVQAHELPSRFANQRRGTQFVTGPCTTDSDCQQGCCAFLTGKCAGPDVAQTNGDGGCGFGNASPNCNVAAALGLTGCIAGAAPPDTTDAGVQAAAAFTANLDGLSFTPSTSPSTNNAAAPVAAAPPAAAPVSSVSQSSKLTVFEACTADSDCQQGCCAFLTGKCAGPDVAQTNGDGGCGHSNTSPNCDVASALKLNACVAGAATPNPTDPEVQAAAAFVSQLDNLPFTPARR
ncbi:hypothetical protein DFH07DRAFT_243014 [Mycena maculata]|uniref:Biotrophy-associated secreted protein 2 n=1 Tax=Mycena maculata TaxID=230809 RepID=A0AAD7JV82_9AGAR|nr:hypothetical protein DFH07DRAFT_243014 [Mycena maculata]